MATGVYKDTVIGVRLGEVRALDGRYDHATNQLKPGQLVTAVGDLAATNGVIYRPDTANHKFTPAAVGTVRGLCVVLNAEEDELRHVTARGKTGRKSVADPFPPREQVRAHVIRAGEEFTFIASGTAAVANGALLAVAANGEVVAATAPEDALFVAIETCLATDTGDARRILCRVL